MQIEEPDCHVSVVIELFLSIEPLGQSFDQPLEIRSSSWDALSPSGIRFSLARPQTINKETMTTYLLCTPVFRWSMDMIP